MVRRRVTLTLGAAGLLLTAYAGACARNEDMPERMEMPDSTMVMKAMEDVEMMDSMLDVMPGGEMARGDSAAAMELLRRKRQK
jgi:hypothetical protein